jgi:protein-tyrosine phosphatase
MPKRVLFLCSGNYYRSRFAEILFNHFAKQRGLDWHAHSRGLAKEFGKWNVGPISPYTVKAIEERGFRCPDPSRDPMHCLKEDLKSADRVIALKEAEHRPMLAERFGGWEDRVEYWHVHDLDGATPEDALREIEQRVNALIEGLASP